MLLKRLITGLILFFGSLALIVWGVLPTALEVAAIVFLSLKEFYKMAVLKYGHNLAPSVNTALFSSVVLFAGVFFYDEFYCFYILVFLLILNLIVFLFRKDFHISPYADIGVTLFGFLYISFTMCFLVFIRKIPGEFFLGKFLLDAGSACLIYLVLIIAFCDVGAYFVGRYFGRFKLWPAISPKKTIEGSLGGIACSVISAVYFGKFLGIGTTQALIMGILLGILAQLGDLFESLLKRDAGVKDSGNVLSGHGGILDRFDSYFLTTPVMYIFLKIFLKL